jgi:hypothetical protein
MHIFLGQCQSTCEEHSVNTYLIEFSSVGMAGVVDVLCFLGGTADEAMLPLAFLFIANSTLTRSSRRLSVLWPLAVQPASVQSME